MPATLERESMEPKPKRKPGRPKGERVEATVKVDKKIAAMAKIIAPARGQSVSEFLSAILDGPVEQEYARLVAKAGKPGE
jgi:hypothetical protein